MKRSLVFSLIFTLMITILFPLQSMAAIDKDLEKAINLAKTKFTIPKAYDKFVYNINKQEDQTLFELTWTDHKNKLGTINVTMDSNGKIINFYTYKPVNPKEQKKLPKISKSSAQKIATGFMVKVNPSLAGKVRYEENLSPVDLADTVYWLNFVRVENGVPFPANSVNVGVNKITGEVQNYNLNWYDNITFPDTTNVLNMTEAQKQYAEKLGLKLLYKQTYDQEAPKIYPAYANVFYNSFLDAKTGEVVTGDGYYGYLANEKGMGGDGLYSVGDNKPLQLTPEELKAVADAAGMLEQSEAEAIARKVLKLDASYKQNSIYLFKNWQSPGDFSWNIEYTREQDDNLFATSISLDAKTGTVLNFYRSLPYDSSRKVKYNQEQTLKIAEDFIKEMQADKLQEVEQNTWNTQPIRPFKSETLPREYSFEFVRKTNGAYYLENGFRVIVDATTGSIINYSFTWNNKELPDLQKVLTAAEAQEILYKEVGLQLQYIAQYSQTEDSFSKIAPRPDINSKPVLKLVYAIKPEQSVNIDAITGKLLNYNGKPYTKPGSAQYSDIKGNFAEDKIRILGELGISLPGNQLKPKQQTTQREFLYLLQRSINPYYDYDLSSTNDDNLYTMLMEAGIVQDGERKPDSKITKQQAVKFIIRALNYDKVAEIKKADFFKLPFKDAGSITKDAYGYMAIAYGLNIVNGYNGYIQPNSLVTRDQAFVMIYNYLNV